MTAMEQSLPGPVATSVASLDTPNAPGAGMAADIAEQPEIYATLIESHKTIAAIAREIAKSQPRHVMYVARGTSDHAALYAAYLTEIRLGIPASLASPSTMTVYGATPDLSGTLVVGVSQSGGSPDISQVLEVARASGAHTVAVTNNDNSRLAKTAHDHVDIGAGHERAVAATKTYTAELMALLLLIEGIRTGNGTLSDKTVAELAVIPELARETLDNDAVVDVAHRYRFADRFITTGRGYAYSTAREAALKLMETSYLPALAFSGADLLHGPLAMVDPSVPVLAVVGHGAGGGSMREVLARLAQQRADIVTVGAETALGGAAHMSSPIVDERYSPLLDILCLQRLAMTLSIAKGENPDAPRGLKKVTLTL